MKYYFVQILKGSNLNSRRYEIYPEFWNENNLLEQIKMDYHYGDELVCYSIEIEGKDAVTALALNLLYSSNYAQDRLYRTSNYREFRKYALSVPRYVADAFWIALNVHKKQKDRGKNPYIIHPLTVARPYFSDTQKAIALLHDVIEDHGNYSVSEIYDWFMEYDIPIEVMTAVASLSKAQGVPYNVYIRTLVGNKDELVVKMSDLAHNMDSSRIPNWSQKDDERLKKYIAAYNFLGGYGLAAYSEMKDIFAKLDALIK